MKNKIIKLIKFDIFIIAINVLMFSDMGFHLRPFMGSGFFGTAVGIFTIYMSIKLLINKHRKVLRGEEKKKATTKDVSTLSSDEDFKAALIVCMPKRNFRYSCETALRQLERMRKKVNVLEEILLQHFEKDSITYTKFHSTINNIEDLFTDNLRKMIAKMVLFDQEEFNRMALTNRNLSAQTAMQRNAIYKEYVDYVNLLIKKNEGILVKLDELLSEISKLEDVEDSSLEELSVLEEVNELVGQVKYYKEAMKE